MCTMLDQRRRRWADIVQMLYKCFVFAGHGRAAGYDTDLGHARFIELTPVSSANYNPTEQLITSNHPQWPPEYHVIICLTH